MNCRCLAAGRPYMTTEQGNLESKMSLRDKLVAYRKRVADAILIAELSAGGK